MLSTEPNFLRLLRHSSQGLCFSSLCSIHFGDYLWPQYVHRALLISSCFLAFELVPILVDFLASECAKGSFLKGCFLFHHRQL